LSIVPRACRRPAGALLGLALLAGCSDRLPTESRLDAPPVPSFSTSAANLSATPAGYIRIGVVPSATSVRIGADGPFTIQNKATGATLFSGSDSEATVTLLTSGTVDTRRWLQTACAGAAARDAWLAKAEALGHETRTEYAAHASCWRLQLGTLDQGWSARVAFRNKAIADGLAGSDSWWPLVTIVHGETRLQLSYGGSSRAVSAPVVLAAEGGLVKIDGKPYRGLAEVWTNSSATLAGINEVRFEEYLYGVVPRELPPTIWDELEAQKAQAVAARTYALSGMGKRSADGYDLLPTTSDQVYGGYAAEHPLSTRAVQETDGVVATYGGKLIQALFSSTTGGHTASNEEVYNSAPVPYLRGVPDAQRGEAFAHVPSLEVFKRHANPTNLRAAAEGDFEADWSRYHRWTFEWTAEEMARVISEATGASVTQVSAINVLERGPSGRVLKIEYVTDAGTFYEYKDRIRWSLKYVTASGSLASLRSTLFFIEPVRDPRTKAGLGFKAYGGGWGHGVGLSQTGAVGMAEKGATYEEILKHYYQGISLETR
jgi:stage II sporulation protein D